MTIICEWFNQIKAERRRIRSGLYVRPEDFGSWQIDCSTHSRKSGSKRERWRAKLAEPVDKTFGIAASRSKHSVFIQSGFYDYENDTPESVVAKLFASAEMNGKEFTQHGALSDCLQDFPSEAQIWLLKQSESYSDSARLCLIGADHWKCPQTYASPKAI
ncbi:hypothetical protein VNO77_01157 [Canavalia gladiata]|uniref:Uncharacterized protein n=1 Tax=Canavalia gladiata TaxID=3824 RepID=A0AAN9R4Q0_CANGL